MQPEQTFPRERLLGREGVKPEEPWIHQVGLAGGWEGEKGIGPTVPLNLA